jgi:hypothetical protein
MEMPAGPGGSTTTPEPGGLSTLITPPSGPPTAQLARSAIAAKRLPRKSKIGNFIGKRNSPEMPALDAPISRAANASMT